MIVKIKDEINNALDFNKSATDLIEKLNGLDDSDFIIDFEGVFFISRSFAQAYFASKRDLLKTSLKLTYLKM